MAQELMIADTEYFATKSEKQQTIYDCDGDFVATVPLEWGEQELKIWADAYDKGIEKGTRWGKDSGEYKAQTDMQKALGIYERLHELESNVKLLASVLYWHDGICKEDVASMAGRG